MIVQRLPASRWNQDENHQKWHDWVHIYNIDGAIQFRGVEIIRFNIELRLWRSRYFLFDYQTNFPFQGHTGLGNLIYKNVYVLCLTSENQL